MWRIIIISADQKITNDNAHQEDTDVESKTETDPRGRSCPLKTVVSSEDGRVLRRLKTAKLGTIHFFCEIGKRFIFCLLTESLLG